jgi:hypothetical protein
VQRIFELYLSGDKGVSLGRKSIAYYLNERGIAVRGQPRAGVRHAIHLLPPYTSVRVAIILLFKNSRGASLSTDRWYPSSCVRSSAFAAVDSERYTWPLLFIQRTLGTTPGRMADFRYGECVLAARSRLSAFCKAAV